MKRQTRERSVEVELAVFIIVGLVVVAAAGVGAWASWQAQVCAAVPNHYSCK